MAAAATIAPVTPSRVSRIDGRRGEYRCVCGHVLRVFGLGRHRVYFAPDNARSDNPVMDRCCPECGRGLPGSNRA